MSGEKTQAYRVLDLVRSEITPFTYFPNETDRDALVAGIASGLHPLLNGEPGGGKTSIAKALAQSMDVSFGRHQGDPRSDTRHILGTRIFDQETNSYRFLEGPIFNNILLADEANRDNPGTQAAYIEAMQEKQVTTMDGVKRPLPDFFRVIATQNYADETEGINLLTDANTDRFGFLLDLSKPYDEEDLLKVKLIRDKWQLTGGPSAVVNEKDMVAAERAIMSIEQDADPDRTRHAQFLVMSVRNHPDVDANESILNKARPTLQMLQLACGLCALENSVTLQESQINTAAPYVLGHRTRLTNSAIQEGKTPASVIAEVVANYA
jgi:MoxR-like ATPase